MSRAGRAGATPTRIEERVDDDELLTYLQEAAAGLAAVPVDGLTSAVPACPGWDVATLVGHVGTVHRWAAANLSAPPGTRVSRRDLPPPPAGPAVLAWFTSGVDEALDVLAATPADRPVWTWAGTQPAGWWRRRLAHETAIHRWDAADALGARVELAPDLAVDGLDELLTVFLPVLAADGPGDGATVHVHATDADGEWLVTFTPAGPAVDRRHAKGDTALRGPAAALLLALWGRTGFDDVEVFGDEALVARLRRAAA